MISVCMKQNIFSAFIHRPLVPPMFLTEKVRTILLMQGATVPKTLIDCPVTGIPVPSVRLYKNGILQSVTSINATDADYAIYQCFANNSAGLSNQIIRALRQGTTQLRGNTVLHNLIWKN